MFCLLITQHTANIKTGVKTVIYDGHHFSTDTINVDPMNE